MRDVLQRMRELAEREISTGELQAINDILNTQKVAIFIVAYNAERHLEQLIDRIPSALFSRFAEIFIIDDKSTDRTYDVANRISSKYSDSNMKVYRTPFNRGYGGNQKLGYLYSIKKNFDIVVLLHGDGQYPPEYIPRILAPFKEREVDAVFASRMLNKKQALQGGMPVYKWIGNQILTSCENRMLGLSLSEFHTGFRAYKVSSLKKLAFEFNSDGFHFDTEIIIQALAHRWKISEVSIPAHYGDEQCRVNGLSYAYNCVKAVLKYQLVQMGLFYQRNFDFRLFETDNYQFKKSSNSLHQYVLKTLKLDPEMSTIELGANHGLLSREIAEKVGSHTAVDQFRPDQAGTAETVAVDLNKKFSQFFEDRKFDCCIALDVVEHLDDPENFLKQVFEMLKVRGTLFISTANVCYLPVRLSLLFGQFNYGKRGILDMTHKRLFSVASFRRLVEQYGFRAKVIYGFSPPIVDLISSSWIMRRIESIHAWMSRHFPNLFAYNFLVIAERIDGLSDIFEQTVRDLKLQESISNKDGRLIN
ncbi:bifunctional glycosyltransferase/class I SAM-dependent methyltransferase [bacterium]|nr:bifunctional glycosyltransferase/class I SAM-dependent methyltransferase [bacterium]